MNAALLSRFIALGVDTGAEKVRAPHKPLLLLAVLDLLEAGLLTDGWVTLSPDLILRFQNLWPIVAERRTYKGDIRMPFYALATDRVWSVFDEESRPSRARITSVRATLDDSLHAALGDSAFREEPRRLLVTTYFPAVEQVALAAALDFERSLDSAKISAFAEDQAAYRAAREACRNARFKKEVVSGYQFTCALTGYRLVTADQAGIVEAAHIHALSSSRNNDSDNGLALTPTAHALFEMGLWSVDDALRVLVKSAATFAEDSPLGGFSLRALGARPLHFAPGARLRPAREHFAWHRREHGFAA